MKLEASTLLPTEFGSFHVRIYRNHQGQEVTAICAGQVDAACDLPVRVHSACFTAEALGSLKCDCKQQLDYALAYIAQHQGVVLYLPQEGRGIGLSNKIRAYALQEQGYDTVEANRMLDLPIDSRSYEDARDILNDLNIGSIRLLTNNPAKLQMLAQLGVQVNGRIPVPHQANTFSAAYMATKQEQMGHLIVVNQAPIKHTMRTTMPAQERPFIHINFALDSQASTLSNKAASGKPAGNNLSCEKDWQRVHELREKYCAVAVGANTWLLDQPRLTARSNILGRSALRQPARVVFCGTRKCQFSADQQNDANHELQGKSNARTSFIIGKHRPDALPLQCHIPSHDHQLAQPLAALKLAGIGSMLVEGGLQLIQSFLQQGMFDLLTIFVRTDCITTATRAAMKAVPGLAADAIEARRFGEGMLLSLVSSENIGTSDSANTPITPIVQISPIAANAEGNPASSAMHTSSHALHFGNA